MLKNNKRIIANIEIVHKFYSVIDYFYYIYHFSCIILDF